MKIALAPLALALLLSSCGGDSSYQASAPSPTSDYVPISTGPRQSTSSASHRRALNIVEAFISRGSYGRHRIRKMRPRYITVHSTQNYSSNATARVHANLLRTGKLKASNNSLGYLTWHYTVDSNSIYQSLPDNEEGQHADYEGPGNRYSIGIEMCENRGSSRNRTVDRTARLIAVLMREHRIPLSHVVPHYHWNRIRYSDGAVLGHKDCPHFLLDNGKPGPKWRAFLATVDRYYRQF